MINAGITGGETIAAGELIRILINHPDVNLRAVTSETAESLPLTQIHRGLEGDTSLRFSSHFEPEVLKKLNVIFLCGEPWQAEKMLESLPDREGEDEEDRLRIVDLTGRYRHGHDGLMVYGLPESNRKALVRGATMCAIPSAGAMAVELALFPLFKGGIHPDHINVTLEIPSTEDYISHSESIAISAPLSTRFDPVAPVQYRADAETIAEEVLEWIRTVQPDYCGTVSVALKRSSRARGIEAVVDLPVSSAPEHIARLIDEAYSDHAFTYLIDRRPDVSEVANTNKCLLYIADPTSPDDLGTAAMDSMALNSQSSRPLRIISVSDNLLKGGAGNAVHCMNLLFGLSERTGLALKASAF